jgi:hypothetical protein
MLDINTYFWQDLDVQVQDRIQIPVSKKTYCTVLLTLGPDPDQTILKVRFGSGKKSF